VCLSEPNRKLMGKNTEVQEIKNRPRMREGSRVSMVQAVCGVCVACVKIKEQTDWSLYITEQASAAAFQGN